MHTLFAIAGAAVNFVACLSYIRAGLKGEATPNRVTWFLWALVPLIAGAAQLRAGVGISTLVVLSVGLGPACIVLASFFAKTQAQGLGDARGRGQLMADTLVERVTGQATAAAVPIEIQLVMPAETLLGQGSEPALVPGYGALPAAFARTLVASWGSAGAAPWVRRLFTTPDGRDLVTMDSRRRRFSGSLRHLIELRDQICRTPWCDAPIRHGDHVIPERRGGATSAANGQGLCEACNYAKEAPGWHCTTLRRGPSPDEPHAPPHTVRTTTPTGHAYDSTAPPVLPTRAATGPPAAASALEHHLEQLLAA
jgi:5-methylcytosine-specific restriction endonuclease McrA